VTYSSSSDVCTRATNANSKNQTDGAQGIDNSFGENIIPLLSAIFPNPSAIADKAFAAGTFGWILSIQGLAADATQPSVGLSADFFRGVSFGQPPNASGAQPTFTLADQWPVDQAMVTSGVTSNGILSLPAVSVSRFPKAYVNDGEFVSGLSEPLDLVIPFGVAPLKLTLEHAIITFHHASATQASGGVIAGVIRTSDLVASVQSVAGNISTSLCSNSTFAQVKTAIEEAADIMTDGTNVAGVPCDAISVGIGFEAAEIGNPRYAGAFPAPPNPCGDGG
jgi:hypothetical protein